MNRHQVKQSFLESLSEIAPEAEPAKLSPTAPLRDQLDIDSFDFLRLMVALHDRLQVDIPERDYRQLATLDGAVGYLAGKLGGR
jgi:acyl carrier protein